MQSLWQVKVMLYTRSLGYRTRQAQFLQGDGVNLSCAGNLAPSMISFINNSFFFPLQHCVGRMKQSRRLKAQLLKALHPNTLLLSMAGPLRKRKSSGEHSSSSIYCRAQKNKLQDTALYCILDPKPVTSTSQAELLTHIHTDTTHWSCSRIHTSMKSHITLITPCPSAVQLFPLSL